MPARSAIFRWVLAAASGALVACGPQATVLIATGPFADRDVRDFDRHNTDDGTRELTIALSGTDNASIKLTVRPADASCWKSLESEHACTQRVPPGTLDEGVFRASGRTCELTGWVEDLGGAFQVDLVMERSTFCDEGHFAATIEP